MKRIYIPLLLLLTFSLTAMGQEELLDKLREVTFYVEPVDSGVNTANSEMGPFFVRDKLYYSMDRKGHLYEGEHIPNGQKFYDVFSVDINQDGRANSSKELVPGFGLSCHEGPGAYCETTGELFMTLSNVLHPDKIRRIVPIRHFRLRLVIMNEIDGRWKIVKELPKFNDKNYNFAHPAISANGDTLIFASNKDMESRGKSDLYMSVRKGDTWSDPINLGDLINTPGNEMYPVFLGKGILSFASDGRSDGRGGLDIYYTTFPNPEKVYNMGDDINSKRDDFNFVIHKSGKVGYFSSNRDSTGGSDNIYQVGLDYRYYALNGVVKYDKNSKLVKNARVALCRCDGDTISTTVTNSYGQFSFEVSRGECMDVEASSELYVPAKKEVNDAKFIELRLKEHRDIVAIDVNSKEPVVGAAITSGDTDLGTTNGKGALDMKPPFPYNNTILISKTGYLDRTFVLDELAMKNGFVSDTVWMYKKQINKAFAMKNIYYNLNKWDILPESKIELDKLVQVMKDNPDINVELGSHTDSRGSDKYNVWLSQKRSESAVKYIVFKGIDKGRIVAKGYGESQLVNRCTNGVKCSEEEHLQNRRTEFKIIGFK